MRPTTSIWIAAGIYFFVVAFVPLGAQLVYPLKLFTTWVHEMGHGLTALVVGGRFDSLEIRADLGGLAHAYAARGLPTGLICAGGLLAPPLLGAVLVATVHGPRRARIALLVISVAIAISLVLWVRSFVGVLAMSVVAVSLAWTALRGFAETPHRRVLAAQLLAVILATDTLTRMVGYSLSSTARAGEASDTQLIANNLGGPHILWGVIVILIAFAAMAFGWWIAIRRSRQPS